MNQKMGMIQLNQFRHALFTRGHRIAVHVLKCYCLIVSEPECIPGMLSPAHSSRVIELPYLEEKLHWTGLPGSTFLSFAGAMIGQVAEQLWQLLLQLQATSGQPDLQTGAADLCGQLASACGRTSGHELTSAFAPAVLQRLAQVQLFFLWVVIIAFETDGAWQRL